MFSFPPTTGMFRFVGFASAISGCHACAWRVAPFGYLRINGRSRLPADFRGLPRPSSPPGAKASSVRPRSLLALACRSARVSARLVRSCVYSFVFVSAFTFPSCQRPAQDSSCIRGARGSRTHRPGPKAGAQARAPARPRPPVVPGRLELPTPTLSVWCSNRLSYGTPPRGSPGRVRALRLSLPGQHLEPFRSKLTIDN